MYRLIKILGFVSKISITHGRPPISFFWGLIRLRATPDTYTLIINLDPDASYAAVQGILIWVEFLGRGLQVQPPRTLKYRCVGQLPFEDCAVGSAVFVELEVADVGKQRHEGHDPLTARRVIKSPTPKS